MSRAEWRHSEERRSHIVTHDTESSLNPGGVEAAITQTTFLERPGHRMVIKRWRIDGIADPVVAEKLCRTRAEHAVKMYRALRALKLPVPTTYRIHESKPEVLMSDLSAGGARLVLTPNNELNYGDTIQEEALNEAQIESIRTQIDTICVRAAKSGIVVGADAYFITLPKDNLAALPVILVGDFGGCQQFQRPSRHDEDFEHDIYLMSQRKAIRGMELLLNRYAPAHIRNRAYEYMLEKYKLNDDRTIWER